MIVAEIHLTSGVTLSLDRELTHSIRFNDLAKATAEYERVAGLLTKLSDYRNSLPCVLEVNGDDGSRVSLPLEHLRSVALVDYVLANEQQAGVRDAFPNIFKS